MIVFDLQCGSGHVFEGWFKDGQAYQEQKDQNLISCPICGNTSVFKLPSTFAVKGSQEAPQPHAELAELGKQLVEFIDKHFENVGSEFAKEALRMHYGISESRNIRGTTSPEEEKMLEKEGIRFFKLPIPVIPETEPES